MAFSSNDIMKTVDNDLWRPAGFWIRFAAFMIDMALIYVMLSGVEFIVNRFNIYVPFEITFVLIVPIYAICFLAWRNQTPGKMLCGLTVIGMNGYPIRLARICVRETIAKFIAGIFLFSGFCWIAVTKSKLGWHDYLVRTHVMQHLHAVRRGFSVVAVIVTVIVVWIEMKAFRVYSVYRDAEHLSHYAEGKAPYTDRDPSSLKEASSLGETDLMKCADWLDLYGKDPVNYAVEAARTHQVTIFGEPHFQRDYLLFLSEIVPELYHKAGVTCLALEVCTAEDNNRLSRLVNGDTFDHDLAMSIARSDNWGGWGAKEHWDVLEEVWKLNKEIPYGEKKMRIIGMDTKWDGPSFGLLGAATDTSVPGPWWEKLRIFRLSEDLLPLLKRDELMARNIEKEIIEKHEHGVVWVGANHSFMNYRQPGVDLDGNLRREWGRMAFMLHQKYREAIFQIILHWKDPSPKLVYTKYEGPPPRLSAFLEDIMARRKNQSVGFDVAQSPFATIRDSNCEYYHFQPRVSFSDVASGYIFLKPVHEITYCEWIPGFITKEMFVRNKPFYESGIHHPLRNAEEADTQIAEYIKKELGE